MWGCMGWSSGVTQSVTVTEAAQTFAAEKPYCSPWPCGLVYSKIDRVFDQHDVCLSCWVSLLSAPNLGARSEDGLRVPAVLVLAVLDSEVPDFSPLLAFLFVVV